MVHHIITYNIIHNIIMNVIISNYLSVYFFFIFQSTLNALKYLTRLIPVDSGVHRWLKLSHDDYSQSVTSG